MHKKNQGFIRGRLVTGIAATLLLAGILYLATTWGQEYYRIKMCQTCTERMFLIEEAKSKFAKEHPGAEPHLYSDLLPYLPFTGFPMCPWGGKYENELTLKKKVTCSLNGNPTYEPLTPGLDPKKNGYMDLAKKRTAMTLFDYVQSKTSGKKNAEAENEAKRQQLFR